MDIQRFESSIYELIVKTATSLPEDVQRVIHAATSIENAGSQSAISLATITENIQLAGEQISPICQDTGMPTFKVYTPVGTNQIEIQKAIHRAVAKATRLGKLRTNSVDTLTGLNADDNLGLGTPILKFEQWAQNTIDVQLILKGGGCENKNQQYSLPAEIKGLGTAGRDLDGVRKCILDAVYQAQGQGCSPGFIGVGIGGDRASGYELAKEQLFRDLDDSHPIAEIAQLEKDIVASANTLGIGTMGFGGKITLLGCKIGSANRLPASFFVSVAYSCWACRRQRVCLDATSGDVICWHNEGAEKVSFSTPTIKKQIKPIVLKTPISEEEVRALKVGDVVQINGSLYTGRDTVHQFLHTNDAPINLNGQVIYHCGPVMIQDEETNQWQVKAAGPTTSIREEFYQANVIKKFGIRAIVGKGGMGTATQQALQEHGAVYLNAIGGAAQHYAECIQSVDGVDFLEWGVPEAMWHFTVKEFTAIVTMDAHGQSLHADVEKSSFEKLQQLLEEN